jgi:hypothetical protein
MGKTTIRPDRSTSNVSGLLESTRDAPMAQASIRDGPGARHLFALVAAGLFGCESSPGPIPIVPDTARGRQAIEAAMATWKAGHPTGIVEPTSPRVQMVDTHRKPGQALLDYEILSDSADPRVRTFSLRLRLSDSEERPVVRFLVVGIDPILVFRQEDYELLMHWEHRMDTELEKTTTPPAPLGEAK